MGRYDEVYKPNVTFTAGQSVSDSTDISLLSLRGLALLVLAADWVTADIGFQVSNDNSTWYTLYDEFGAGVKVAGVITNAAAVYACPAGVWAVGGFKYLRLVSRNTGAFGTDVIQTSTDKEIELATLA